MKMELFPKKFNARHWTTLQSSGDMRMLSDLQLVYMVPGNCTQLLNINTTKFQVERELVWFWFWFWFINQQDSLTNMFADVLA